MKKKFIGALMLGLATSICFAQTQDIIHADPAAIVAVTDESLNQEFVLDLNGATIDELQYLDGIGKSKAQNIIEYREKYGPFISVNQLLEVQGIGESLLERNRHKLMI